MIVETALELAPLVVLALGLAIGVALIAIRNSLTGLAPRLLATVVKGTLILALAATARLWIVNRGQTIDIRLVESTTRDTFVVPGSTILSVAHLDTLALGGLTIVLLLAWLDIALQQEPSIKASVNILIDLAACLLVGLLIDSADSISVATLWFALAVLGLATIVASRRRGRTDPTFGVTVTSRTFDHLRGWLALVVVGAPTLWVVGSILVGANGRLALFGGVVPPLVYPITLVVVGAATAAILPLAGWRDGTTRYPEVALIAGGLGPLGGFFLAARAVGMASSRSDGLPLTLLGLIVITGLILIPLTSRRSSALATLLTLDRVVGFLLLAVPLPLAPVVGLVLIGLGSAVRIIERRTSSALPRWLRSSVSQFSTRSEVLPDIGTGVETKRRSHRFQRPVPDPVERMSIGLANVTLQIEDRYDVAVGLLVALAVLLTFAG